MQTLFIRGPSVTFRMTALVIASIALMTMDHQWKSLEMVRGTLSSVLYPLQYTIDLPIRLYYWADEVFSDQQILLEKNREFEARHLENRVQLQKLIILEKENDRLRRLLSAIPKTTERSQGVMGQIIHVGPMSSTAMLITDASHAIPVQVNRTGLRANAFGTGKIDQLNLRHLPHNVDIKVGDLLITSGLGGTFPPNFPVAIISKIEHRVGEPFATIEAKPHAQLDKNREVLLIWRNKAENTENNTDDETSEADNVNDDLNKEKKRRGNRE
jgi:rod shape-determining protein MreC